MKPILSPLPFTFPLLICAPMVDQSQLPFRMLTRKYGTNLCYTPMLHSKMLLTNKKYKLQHFTTCQQDRPLVAQLCGNDPQTMVSAAKLLQHQVDAIDINLGCPQAIAKRGHYGSFLLDDPQLIYNIVRQLVKNINIPIFCKIRIKKTQVETFQIIDKIINAGCSLITIHGRIKQQNKDKVGACNWNIIKKIKKYVNIPVIANGGIHTFTDVLNCLQQTEVDGIMSAQSLLQNPALFSGKIHCLDTLASQYLDLTQKYPGASVSCIRGHLFKMLFKGLKQNIDLREKLAHAISIEEFRYIVEELKNRRMELSLEEKFGWYRRYWEKCYVQPEYPMTVGDGQQQKQSKNDESQHEQQYKVQPT